MKRVSKFSLVLSLIVFMLAFLPVFAMADSPYYQYKETIASGTPISGGASTAKFQMSDGYVAFCLDKTVIIKTKINYIKMSLEDAVDAGHFNSYVTKADVGVIRAILNYAWSKTNKDEIAAIQYALWHFTNKDNIPSDANSNIKKIYNKLIALDPIPADHEIINNAFTITADVPEECTEIGEQFNLDIAITTTFNTTIQFHLYLEGKEVDASKYGITEDNGVYTLAIPEPKVGSYKLVMSTPKNKSVNAYVFLSVETDKGKDKINKKLSQTVLGMKPEDTLQTEEISFCFKYTPEPTPEPTPTPTETTTPPTTEATTIPTTTEPPVTEATTTEPPVTETTTTEATTTTTTTEATIVSTTTSTTEETTVPTTEPTEPSETTTEPSEATTTTIAPSTSPTTTYPTDDLPKTGESNGMERVVGVLVICIAGILWYTKRKVFN